MAETGAADSVLRHSIDPHGIFVPIDCQHGTMRAKRSANRLADGFEIRLWCVRHNIYRGMPSDRKSWGCASAKAKQRPFFLLSAWRIEFDNKRSFGTGGP